MLGLMGGLPDPDIREVGNRLVVVVAVVVVVTLVAVVVDGVVAAVVVVGVVVANVGWHHTCQCFGV